MSASNSVAEPDPSDLRPVAPDVPDVTSSPSPDTVSHPSEKPEISSNNPNSGPSVPLTADNAASIWDRSIDVIEGAAATYAKSYEQVAISAPNCLVVRLCGGYTIAKSICEQPDQLVKFEQAVSETVGAPVRVQFELGTSAAKPTGRSAAPVVTRDQRLHEMKQHPLIQKANELFGATVTDIIPPPKPKE